MISEDMLKKLLDEFVEKEALIQEELKVIEEQIVELESRLAGCNGRLVTIAGDRDKVVAMRSRYVEGNFTFEAAQGFASSSAVAPPDTHVSSSAAVAMEAPTAATTAQNGISAILHSRIQAVPPDLVAAPHAPPQPDSENRESAWSHSPVEQAGGSFLYPEPDASSVAPAQVDEHTSSVVASQSSVQPVELQTSASASSSPMVDLGTNDGEEEADNDTVKSINDALRSLFR